MNRSQVVIPGAALFFCVVGLVGLFLPLGYAQIGGSVGDWPLVRGFLSFVNGSVFDRPLLGVLLLVVFLSLSALPALDLKDREVQWTQRLLVPVLIGFLPIVGVTVVLTWFGSLLEDWIGANFAALGAGAGTILLLVADLGLIGASGAAVYFGEPEPQPVIPPRAPLSQREQKKKGPDPDL